MVQRKITVRITRDTCSEAPTCPKQATVDQDPEHTYFVFTEVTDPDIRAAFATHIGPGEALGKVPNYVAGR